MSKIINKDGIVEYLQTQEAFSEASKKATKEFLEDLVDFIKDAVVAGDTVSIPGFGKFAPFTRQNGTVKPKFTPFKDFSDAVKG